MTRRNGQLVYGLGLVAFALFVFGLFASFWIGDGQLFYILYLVVLLGGTALLLLIALAAFVVGLFWIYLGLTRRGR